MKREIGQRRVIHKTDHRKFSDGGTVLCRARTHPDWQPGGTACFAFACYPPQSMRNSWFSLVCLAHYVVLTDVNFSSSLIPLIGERVEDRKLIADYVASLRQLSYWLFALMVWSPSFHIRGWSENRGWDWQTVWTMVAILLVACWFVRISASYGAVLILLRDRPSWYRGQMISSLGTLALLGALWLRGWLNGLTAILLNVAGMVFVGIFYFLRGRRLLGAPGQGSAEKRRSICPPCPT